MSKLSLRSLVSSFVAAFESDKREDGTDFLKLSENKAEWMTDAIRAAHADMMPEDRRYAMILESLEKIVDCMDDDAEDFDNLSSGELADSMVDIYNWDRLQWLASNLYRAYYCDEAAENGLSENATMFERIGYGQYMEYVEILESLYNSILEVCENQEENEE